MDTADAWYAALCVLAEHSPMTFWQMANGAEFWWSLSSRSQLLPDRFSEEPFYYGEIVSATVLREVRAGGEVLGCDWEPVHGKLSGITGLQIEFVSDLVIPPAVPPNEGLRLSVTAGGPGS